nr:GNAT family acetyltransferase [Cavernulicola chilensis]
MLNWTNCFQSFKPLNELDNTNIPLISFITHSLSSSKNLEYIFLKKNRPINLYKLEELCDSVGWSRRPLRKVKKALYHSCLVISIIESKENTERLIGFARVTSDCAFNATIWDVVIHPDFQKMGIGKILVQEVVKELRSKDIANITLFADPKVTDFYKNIGFMCDPYQLKGMFWEPK